MNTEGRRETGTAESNPSSVGFPRRAESRRARNRRLAHPAALRHASAMNTPPVLPMLFLLAAAAIAGETQFRNGGFESGLSGWRLWSRTPGALTSALENKNVHLGQAALRLEHHGEQDWSLEPSLRLEVRPGDLVELNCWVRACG